MKKAAVLAVTLIFSFSVSVLTVLFLGEGGGVTAIVFRSFCVSTAKFVLWPLNWVLVARFGLRPLASISSVELGFGCKIWVAAAKLGFHPLTEKKLAS